MWSRRRRPRSLFFRKRNSNNETVRGRGTATTPTVQVVDNNHQQNQSSSPSQQQEEKTKRLSLLYALCKQWAWPAVDFRCTTHPEEASAPEVNENGENCLHWVCFGKPPLQTVERLVAACPQLASSPNANGSLPIHVACAYRASDDVIRHLLKVYPDGASTRGRMNGGGGGSFPLHMVCDSGSSIDVLRAILETKQGMATINSLDGIYQQTPLAILNARKNLNMFLRDLKVLKSKQARRGDIRTCEQEGSDDVDYESLYSIDFWQKAALLVSTEYNSMDCDTDTNDPAPELESSYDNIVHACVGLAKCPSSLLEFAMLLHPHQLMEPDRRQGRLPLHIAAASLPQSSSRLLIDVLLRSPPSAARVCDADGNLPLELAVSSGKRWGDGVGDLVATWTPSLEVLFLPDALYPYIWSRLLQLPHHDGVYCVYESIRAKPNIVMYGTSSFGQM